MPSAPAGLHHVTAIATDPQHNVDFYVTLGLRLVKVTVNFDAPDTYHLYFGGESGQPGTLITFFPWPGAPRGRRGAGQATTVSFSVPEGSLGWWRDHLQAHAIEVGAVVSRAEEEAFSVRDPDGLALELVAHTQPELASAWEDGPIPPEHAIRRLHSVTLTEALWPSKATASASPRARAAPGPWSTCSAALRHPKDWWLRARCTTSPGALPVRRSRSSGAAPCSGRDST
jgi:glyoxalase family protein